MLPKKCLQNISNHLDTGAHPGVGLVDSGFHVNAIVERVRSLVELYFRKQYTPCQRSSALILRTRDLLIFVAFRLLVRKSPGLLASPRVKEHGEIGLVVSMKILYMVRGILPRILGTLQRSDESLAL